MLFKSRDKWGRWEIHGFGYVWGVNGEKPVIFSKVGDSAKAYFRVCAGVVKNPEGAKYKYDYNIVPCAAYGRQHNRELFALCKKLNTKDKVFFGGIFYPNKATNGQGVEVDFSELRLEYLLPYNSKIVNYCLKVMKRDKDDELFDNEDDEPDNIEDLRTKLDIQKAVDTGNNAQSDDYDF